MQTNAVTVPLDKLKLLIQFALDQGFDEEDLMDAAYDINISIEVAEAKALEVNECKAIPAPKPNNVQDGWVMGSVSTGYVGSRAEFQVCTVEEWAEMSEDEANTAVGEAVWNTIDVGF